MQRDASSSTWSLKGCGELHRFLYIFHHPSMCFTSVKLTVAAVGMKQQFNCKISFKFHHLSGVCVVWDRRTLFSSGDIIFQLAAVPPWCYHGEKRLIYVEASRCNMDFSSMWETWRNHQHWILKPELLFIAHMKLFVLNTVIPQSAVFVDTYGIHFWQYRVSSPNWWVLRIHDCFDVCTSNDYIPTSQALCLLEAPLKALHALWRITHTSDIW